MRDYLLFQLYGPMAAWGVQAVGQERDSAIHPSKSAIMGLLAAALGIEREHDEAHLALAAHTKFAVKLLASGYGFRDFHTAQYAQSTARAKHLHTRRDQLAHEKISTVISYRGYRQDSAAVVALWCSDQSPHSLVEMAQALKHPVYAPYLGRRSCAIALPLNPKVQSANTLREALDAYPLADELQSLCVGQKEGASYFWDACAEAGMNADYQVVKSDNVLSRTRWQFSERVEQTLLNAAEEGSNVLE